MPFFQGKKLVSSHHCATGFSTRVFYNSNFKNKELFDETYVKNLVGGPMVKAALYSDVVKCQTRVNSNIKQCDSFVHNVSRFGVKKHLKNSIGQHSIRAINNTKSPFV